MKIAQSTIWIEQVPRVWYERLHKYLVQIGFERTNDNNMYIKLEEGKDILISTFFVDDIIFGGKEVLSKDFANKMKHEFEMSMFGEINSLLDCKYIK